MSRRPVSKKTALEHGLSEEEFELAKNIMGGKAPNLVELGIFSVMWSEHCSYKSTKLWLKTLPTEGPQVIEGPGENAGVIDIGDGQACIFKIESHNHPSFIEPFHGAATGVGGILRDVFTMGARPIALMNALRFGDTDHSKTRSLVDGVVRGIAHYGNCVGVPTVGGETQFDKAYDGNNLVNAMAIGLADADKIFKSAATHVGAQILYVGAKTGRDGIHGATMASAEFDDGIDEKRPTVQVGDPFTEKLLIEACLELMSQDCILAIQDMGAAGLTSSSFEMASKGGTGVRMNLDRVPQREQDMTPYEIMLSESQERMLMVIEPGKEDQAASVFKKWGLDAELVGEITNTGRMVIEHGGKIVADLPIDPLALASPEYDRPWVEPTLQEPLKHEPKMASAAECLRDLLSHPNLASKAWIYEQYDQRVMNDTVAYSGGDAALVRVHKTDKAIAITTDCNPHFCLANPERGAAFAVAEAYRNLSAVGAKPLAVTNNLNYGNPEKPEIMGQIVTGVRGMANACKALDTPVVSGNVSLYNETDGSPILPTPVIGGIGLKEHLSPIVGIAYDSEGLPLVRLGPIPGTADLGQSALQRLIFNDDQGDIPPLDLELERATGDLVRGAIQNGWVNAAHDVSDGGTLTAAAEMAIASNIGADLTRYETSVSALFGETCATYLLVVKEPALILNHAAKLGIKAQIIGRTGGNGIRFAGEEISIEELRDLHGGWMHTYMS
ncbi:MAG: phosphoribosylformylglycinamidine synthase subunit PurL [Alphaproteobacteria bacterium]